VTSPAPAGGEKKEVAVLKTSMGTIVFEFWPQVAPKMVANFKDLAKSHFYDGTTFHRVIRGFMIQGGDPMGSGAGEPGYVIPDEIWAGAHHNERGQLCMANRGKNTNGMQFFIMDGEARHLDGGYTIFGKCAPEDVIVKLASVEVQGDHSVKPTKINKVVIKRKPKKDDKGAAKADGSAKPAAAAAPAAPKPAAAPAAPATPAAPAPAAPAAPAGQ